MKRIISLALAVLLIAALFVGCSGSSNPAGTYVIKTINDKSLKDYFTEAFAAEAGDSDLDMTALLGLLGIDLDHPEEFMKIALNEDGTVEILSKFSSLGEGEEDEEDEKGTWKQEGDKIIITANGETSELTYKNGELIMTAEEDGKPMTMVLAKQ